MNGGRLKAAILDFDGTLVESVGIKDNAFRTLFADEAEHVEAIMAYHLAHNHVLRFEKFRHIVQDILGRPYTSEDEQRLSRRFSALVKEAIIAAPEVPGASALLTTLSSRLPLYLLSMSPDEELCDIVAARGLEKWFVGIYGGSWAKIEAVRDILARERATPAEAVMIGDSPEDFAAADALGVPFIGRDSGKKFPVEAGAIHADMRAVLERISRMLGE